MKDNISLFIVEIPSLHTSVDCSLVSVLNTMLLNIFLEVLVHCGVASHRLIPVLIVVNDVEVIWAQTDRSCFECYVWCLFPVMYEEARFASMLRVLIDRLERHARLHVQSSGDVAVFVTLLTTSAFAFHFTFPIQTLLFVLECVSFLRFSWRHIK